MAVSLPQGAQLREVVLEALGDDFAQVSGQWLEGARIAQFLQKAVRLWAFAASSDEDVADMMEGLPCGEDERIVAIAPGRQPGWPKSDAAFVRAMLEEAPPHAIVGLMMAITAPSCTKGCCGATKGQGCALYCCNSAQQN